MTDPKIIILTIHPELLAIGNSKDKYPTIVSCKMFLGCCYQYILRLCVCRRNDLKEPEIYEYIPMLKTMPGYIIPGIIEVLDWEVSIVLTQLSITGIDNPHIESVDRHVVAISNTNLYSKYSVGETWEK